MSDPNTEATNDEPLGFDNLWSELGLSDPIERAKPLSTPIWQRKWFRGTASVLVILLPVFAYLAYDYMSTVRQVIHVAVGPTGGRHQEVEWSIFHRLSASGLADVLPKNSTGSLENIRRLQIGDIHVALYQSGTEKLVGDLEFYELDENGNERLELSELPAYWSGRRKRALVLEHLDENKNGWLELSEFQDLSELRFVANMFSEFVHVFVRNNINDVNDLVGKRVAVGEKSSGNYAMSLVMLEHLGIDDRVDAVAGNYTRMLAQLKATDPAERVDAAIVTIGLGAPQINKILTQTDCRLLPVPRIETLCMRHVFVSPSEIPAGMYRTPPPNEAYLPSQPVPTVSVKVMIVRHDLQPFLVRQVTRNVLSDDFLRQSGLYELYRQEPSKRRELAQSKPDFAVHDGAGSFYDPHKFDAGEFEGWEALYSLIASAVIAGFFGVRWLIRRRERLRGHRLDVYLRRLLKLELSQAVLDDVPGRDDSRRLQELLNEITGLRQQALGEFSAHELNDDPAQFCFLEMCHYISEKINAKLLRQTLDRRFRELSDSMQASDQAANSSQN